jgi:hypothetical protein
MNTVLNENWRELVQELEPSFREAIGLIIMGILTNITELFPFDEVFPETV